MNPTSLIIQQATEYAEANDIWRTYGIPDNRMVVSRLRLYRDLALIGGAHLRNESRWEIDRKDLGAMRGLNGAGRVRTEAWSEFHNATNHGAGVILVGVGFDFRAVGVDGMARPLSDRDREEVGEKMAASFEPGDMRGRSLLGRLREFPAGPAFTKKPKKHETVELEGGWVLEPPMAMRLPALVEMLLAGRGGGPQITLQILERMAPKGIKLGEWLAVRAYIATVLMERKWN